MNNQARDVQPQLRNLTRSQIVDLLSEMQANTLDEFANKERRNGDVKTNFKQLIQKI